MPTHCLAHKESSFPPIGLVAVVRAAAKLQVFHSRGTSVRVRHDMVPLEERLLSAAALGPDERALTAIARPHRTPDVTGDVARARFVSNGSARELHDRKPLLLSLLQQYLQRPLDDRGWIRVRNPMPQQV